jgi:NAD(P)-dependent dehydrogenase (short-subunit alcohol dehydrogenase family)
MRSELFDLTGRVAIITGGAGLLGTKHAEAIAAAGGVPVVVDIRADAAERAAVSVAATYGVAAFSVCTDITQPEAVRGLLEEVLERTGRVDILINNAANNPPPSPEADAADSRLEHFSLDQWHTDLEVGLTGAFLCSQIVGSEMARRGKGVIVNIASDLALVSPDQRLYRDEQLAEHEQPVKSITYSVIKTALLGLTRYLATYWATSGVRVNALSPGGVYNGQSDVFVERLASRIPLSRMAHPEEYQGAIVFLCCDASSYMTGANLVIDGGRNAW